jgi:hypothetical protein
MTHGILFRLLIVADAVCRAARLQLDFRSLVRHLYHEIVPAGQVMDTTVECQRLASGASVAYWNISNINQAGAEWVSRRWFWGWSSSLVPMCS